jgi:hypothetical protein
VLPTLPFICPDCKWEEPNGTQSQSVFII